MFTQKDREKCDKLFERYYKGKKFSRGLYCERIKQYVSSTHRVLDAGCGRYLEFSKELPNSAQVTGVDLEPTLETHNEQSPYGVRANLERLPFGDNYFDVVISRSVIEHLEQPGAVFREFHRVLKPGGKVILSTPNKYDYVSVAASLTPYRWHRAFVSKAIQVPADDVFPTLYRANTRRALRKHLTAAGLVEKELDAISHYPVYVMFSPVLFRLGVLYERLTALESLRWLRGTLLCVFEKPADSGKLASADARIARDQEASLSSPVR